MSAKPAALSMVDTTKTTTATSSKAGPARKGPRTITVPSVFHLAAAQWNAMSGDEKNSYAALNGLLANTLEPAAPTKKTAFTTFVAMSAANIATGQPLQSTAPPYAPAPPLPDAQLVASYADGAFTLKLVVSDVYSFPVAIKAARPMLAASSVYKSTAFKKIGSVKRFADTVDITDLYQSRFRVPGTGYKIALELMGVAPGGFPTASVYVFAAVTADPSAAPDPGPEGGQSQAVSLHQVG